MRFSIPRRAFGTAIAAVMLAASGAVFGQPIYPTRAITIVVPYSPGGSTDALARLMGQKLSIAFGQPVVVENKAGAGSNIGVGYVARSAPDGYTIGLATSTALSANPGLYKSLPFDAEQSFEHIVLATVIPSILVVSASMEVDNIQQFNEYVKRPGVQVNYASSGIGTAPHLAAEQYRASLGFDATHVPYKGGAPALVGLVGKETTFMIAVSPEAMPLVKHGKLKALAVTTLERLKEYPQLPTLAESGVPGFEMLWGYGFVAPKGTPRDIVAKLNAAFNGALKDPEVSEKLNTLGFEIAGGDGARMAQMMRGDRGKWKKLIDELGITSD